MVETEEILNETLFKKNKELKAMQKLNEDTKREYEEKIKNLEGSISTLKKQNAEINAQSQDNKRIEIIQRLKNERKEQELIITLIRKMINKEKDVNAFLQKEFIKGGDQRKLSYEELKIKIKEKEDELRALKFLQEKIIEKFKDQINDYDQQINDLEEENRALKKSKKEMENSQKELFEKMKEYNNEVDEMNMKYNMIKDEVKQSSTEQINKLHLNMEKLKEDNQKYKKRILELISIGEKNEKQDIDRLSKINRDLDIYTKLLETKNQEIEDYKKELNELKDDLQNIDSKQLLKVRRLENQANELNKDNFDLEVNIQNLNNVIQQKDNQIKNLKNTQEALTEEIQIKEQEIILLNSRIAEFENLLMKKKEDNEI